MDLSLPQFFDMSINQSFNDQLCCVFPNRMARPKNANSSSASSSVRRNDAPPRSDEELKNTNVWKLTDEEIQTLARIRRKDDAYKTALCDSFRKSGQCSYGANCRFAHSQSELRCPNQPRGRLHPKYKTVLCDKFQREGFCRYGSRCQFIHRTPAEQRNPFSMQDLNLSLPPVAPYSLASSLYDSFDKENRPPIRFSSAPSPSNPAAVFNESHFRS